MRDQRGLSESVQWAVLMPLLLLMVLGISHAGIWLVGRDGAREVPAWANCTTSW